jgi:hypothetical protein
MRPYHISPKIISPMEIEAQNSDVWLAPDGVLSCYTYAPVISPREIDVQEIEVQTSELRK